MTTTNTTRKDDNRRTFGEDRTERDANLESPTILGRGNPPTRSVAPANRDSGNLSSGYAPTLSRAGPGRGAGTEPTEEDIRRRAYEIYQSRGGEAGREMEDWAQAERELRNKKKTQ